MFLLTFVEPKMPISLKMPSHYPSHYDYADLDNSYIGSEQPPTVAPSKQNVGVILTISGIIVCGFLVLAVLIWIFGT